MNKQPIVYGFALKRSIKNKFWGLTEKKYYCIIITVLVV